MPTTNTALAACAAYLTTNWAVGANTVPTFEWEEAKLQARPPMATFWVDRRVPLMSAQGPLNAWKRIDVLMRVYVSLAQREKAAQVSMSDVMDALLTLLATDPTLGRAVEKFVIDEDGASQRVDLDEKLLITEIPVEVTPWPTQ